MQPLGSEKFCTVVGCFLKLNRLGILKNFPFIVADHDFFRVVVDDVVGIDWHLAAAAWGIDDILRNGVSTGETTK